MTEEQTTRISQQLRQLKVQLETAIEHGDAVEQLLFEENKKLLSKNQEHKHTEQKLLYLLQNLQQEKKDLETVIDSIIDHSDRLDLHLLTEYQRVQEASLTDPLTGLANRRGFLEHFDKCWKQAKRQDYLVGLIFIDIDYFKQYNDHYGHHEGDICLQRIAKLMTNACYRETDFISRYGGEEFIILISVKDLASVKVLATRLHKTFLQEKITHEKTLLEQKIVTASLGCGLIKPDKNNKPNDFIKQVDALLYQAKEQGRNQIRYQSFNID